MKQRIASLISSVLNPFLVSFVTVIIVAMDSTTSLVDGLKWAAVALALSIFPVFAFVLLQVRRKKMVSMFSEPRGQRKIIYVLAGLVGAIGYVVMSYFKAPELLRVYFIAGLVAVTVFMTINLWWKISVHTAFISSAAAMLILVYGAKATWAFALLPPVAWARIVLKLHTPAQTVAGAVLAAVIVAGVFWGFGAV